MKLKDFILVIKPGIVVGNTAAALGAFLAGSRGAIVVPALYGVVLGTAGVIAGSCVVNNYLDRDIDAKMTRTARRPSVTGALPADILKIYACVLYVIGFGCLAWLTSVPTLIIGLAGAFLYTVVYDYIKRRSSWGTWVGAIPGATPPLAGFVAANIHLDQAAWLLFATMFAWQLPHFHAIGVWRRDQYRAASVPVLVATKGLSRTVWEMRIAGMAFTVLCFLLARWAGFGFMFGTAMVVLGLYWLVPMFSPHWRRDTTTLARTVFKRSLHVLLGLCFFLAMSHVLL